MKRRLEKAQQSVKIQRTQDILSLLEKPDNLLQDSTPAIYRVFQKQSEALDFGQSFGYSTFALEHDFSGKRHFITCHPHTFWKWLTAKPPNERHAYEVIGEDMPSKVWNSFCHIFQRKY